MDALPGMSWRRFRVLLAGLGPNSALVNHLAQRKPRGKRHGGYGEPMKVINADNDPAAFDAFWQSMIPKSKRNGKAK